MQESAAAHGALLTFGQESWRWSPRPSEDVVVIDSIAAWRMLPAVVRWRRRIPFVAVVHQRPGGTDGRRLWRGVKGALDRAVYRRCRAVIAASGTLHRSLLADRRVDAAAVVVVEPGCDLPAAPPPIEMRAGRRAALLSVANWYPNKGVLELLEAFAALPEEMATLHLAGRVDVHQVYATRVSARLARPDLLGRVIVHGGVDIPTVAGLYAGADAFVATAAEGYATVFAEALAAGLPIVGWRQPFLEHFVRDGVEGRLADPGDVAALTAALTDVLGDDQHRARFAAAAARRGHDLPTWADTANRFFAVIAGSVTATVEPAQDRSARLDVDPADARVLDEEPPRQRARGVEGPLDGGLDRADVRDDDDRR